MHWATLPKLCRGKADGGLGFRDLLIFNQVMLAKKCWRLVKNPDSLSTRVLRACYFQSSDFMTSASSSKGSFVWQSLCWGRELLEKGTQWRIGRGAAVSIMVIDGSHVLMVSRCFRQ
ncbi:hypothetical protein Dsin_002321 [Dipteronia sinensis]|uniref:Uncharacterized protein n=1 Tax=Dipteronia sinensis TaxID=43782 RepID=A0AAE0EL47_9ROSI|nr:hypothetical protein Dsin_002321 [Dipteronia sinensis]